MKAKHLFLATAALLAAGGLWFARWSWRAQHIENQKSSTSITSKTPHDGPTSGMDATSKALQNGPNSGQVLNPPTRLAPPDPNRKFWELTPEQRVERARHPVGG